MFWRNIAANLWRIAIFLAAFAIALYVLIEFRIWGSEFTLYLIRIGEWEMIVFVSLLVAAVSMFLIKLLQWETRAVTRRR